MPHLKTIVDCLKIKGVTVSYMVGMGFDGAAMFSGKHNGFKLRENLLTQFLFTATVICYGLLVSKLLTVLPASNT